MCIRLSLKIEPPATSTPRTTASREDLTGEKRLRPTHTDANQASCHTSLLSCYPNQMQPWCDNTWCVIMPGLRWPRWSSIGSDFPSPKLKTLGVYTFLLMISFFRDTGPDTTASPLCGRRGNVAEGALPKVPPTPPSPRNLITYGHRKCHSLGYKCVWFLSSVHLFASPTPLCLSLFCLIQYL